MFLSVIVVMDSEPENLSPSIKPYFEGLTIHDGQPGQLPPRVLFVPASLQAENVVCAGWLMGTHANTNVTHLATHVNEWFRNLNKPIRFGFRVATIRDGIEWSDATKHLKIRAVHLYVERHHAGIARDTLNTAFKKYNFCRTLTNLPIRAIAQYDAVKPNNPDNPMIKRMIGNHKKLLLTLSFTSTNYFGDIDYVPTNCRYSLRAFLLKLKPEHPATADCRIFVGMDHDAYRGGILVWYENRYELEALNYIQYAPLYMEKLMGPIYKRYLSEYGLEQGADMKWVNNRPTSGNDRLMSDTEDILRTRFHIDIPDDLEPAVRRPVFTADDITLDTRMTRTDDSVLETYNQNTTMEEAAAPLMNALFNPRQVEDNPAPTTPNTATLTPGPRDEGTASGQQG